MMTTERIAVLVFLVTYALIIDERVHRAVATMAGAAVVVSLGIVPWDSLLHHIDFGTIFLLMRMMIIVNTARNSGLFEYIAIRTTKCAGRSPPDGDGGDRPRHVVDDVHEVNTIKNTQNATIFGFTTNI